MIEFGTYLRNAREHAGLSLQDLHERTRISVKNLRLIESGDFPSIPQTYVRAFVREYARVVGLDETDILSRYNEEAERERGIPRPPDAIDSSNLLPKVDDTVEFLLPSDLPPSHVEVVGTAEVEDDQFVVPVRKSTYVKEGDAEAIDIRTAAPKPERGPAPPGKPPDAAPAGPSKDRVDAPGEAEAKAEEATVVPKQPSAPSTGQQGTPPRTPAPPEQPPTPVVGEDASQDEEPSDRKPAAALPSKTGTPKTTPPARTPQPAPTPAPAAPSQPLAAPVPPPVPPVQRDAASEKRIIGVGMVIIALLAIIVYGLVYFGSSDDDETAAVDSTSIKASIEAGRFIDSSQYALTDIDLAAEDTAALEAAIPPEPVEARPREFAKEDSLVLEAFTSAPVWISVKMDTLRTERSSLLSNEHRIWKAKDYFVVTLGDAGAVTFFLNGKEIGTLGEEGSVVKNITLSRQQLNGN